MDFGVTDMRQQRFSPLDQLVVQALIMFIAYRAEMMGLKVYQRESGQCFLFSLPNSNLF